ncbi:MAG: membrane integrity-associated transporter subunit PqiC [Deltaproteobacteria bacterium]|nr:membrane integrity-associated transporter subunit PqiC [Deltaproteobacteria bacterium]
MDSSKKMLIAAFVFLLCLAGCVNLKQPSRRIDFYTLEYDPPRISRPAVLPVSLKVERFSVAPGYNTMHIVFRDRSFKRNTYIYRQWRANPGDLISYFLYRDIRHSGLFKAALPAGNSLETSYVLDGSVDGFFEWDTDSRWKAVLSFGVVLIKEAEPDVSRRIVIQKNYHAEQACSRKNPQALASAMSRAMAELSTQVIADVYDALLHRPR